MTIEIQMTRAQARRLASVLALVLATLACIVLADVLTDGDRTIAAHPVTSGK